MTSGSSPWPLSGGHEHRRSRETHCRLSGTGRLAGELAGDDVVSVEVVGGLEGHERADAEHERSEYLVADVEVVMRVARALPRHDAVVRVIRGVLGETDAELGTLLQAPEDEVDAESPLPLHVGPVGTNVVFFFSLLVLSGFASGHSMGIRWLRANASTHCWYACVRLVKASLVIGYTPCTSRKKCTMCSGRVNSGR